MKKENFWSTENIAFSAVIIMGVCMIIAILKDSYDYQQSHVTVCETRTSKVTAKLHEVESINAYGATRNNYYLYLEDGERLEVDVNEYALTKEGDSWNYQECWVERK